MDNKTMLDEAKNLVDLGNMYYMGEGVERNYKKAKKYYEQAKRKNSIVALYKLGFMYENGKGVSKSYQKAKVYYEQAAEKGQANAYYRLGCMYEEGKGVSQDYQKAKDYFEQAAQKKLACAQESLGLMYLYGNGVPQDDLKAWKYFKQATAQNSPRAFRCIGIMYFQGYGVPQDYQTAREFFRLAANKGDADAWVYLGICHYDNLGLEFSSKIEARTCFEKAAKLGSKRAYFYLGFYYLYHTGLMREIEMAYKYFILATKEINEETNRAWNYLGEMYERGLCVKKNYSRAMMCYRKAVKLGNLDTIIYLGDKYYKRKIFKNYFKAKKYYELAAELGDENSQCILGNMYEKGKGVRRDYQKAKECYEQAITNGSKEALSYLGNMYEKGKGVPQDLTKAKEYYTRASDQPNLLHKNATLSQNHLNGYGKISRILQIAENEWNNNSAKLKEIEIRRENAKKFMQDKYFDEAMLNVRHIIELILKDMVSNNIPNNEANDTFAKINLLYEKGFMDREIASIFHNLRKKANMGAHSSEGPRLTESDMKDVNPMVEKIVEFYRSYLNRKSSE